MKKIVVENDVISAAQYFCRPPLSNSFAYPLPSKDQFLDTLQHMQMQIMTAPI